MLARFPLSSQIGLLAATAAPSLASRPVRPDSPLLQQPTGQSLSKLSSMRVALWSKTSVRGHWLSLSRRMYRQVWVNIAFSHCISYRMRSPTLVGNLFCYDTMLKCGDYERINRFVVWSNRAQSSRSEEASDVAFRTYARRFCLATFVYASYCDSPPYTSFRWIMHIPLDPGHASVSVYVIHGMRSYMISDVVCLWWWYEGVHRRSHWIALYFSIYINNLSLFN